MAVRSRVNRDGGTKPRVRRAYFECRYGQLHVYNAMPAGGGFEEATTLLCLHETPLTGRMFAGALSLWGGDRSVYAPDLPGFGESEAPPSPPAIQDYAAAIGDFIDTMRFRKLDVLGSQTGALVAAELAISRPAQVRRVILASIPALTEAERSQFLRAPWPTSPNEDGSYLMTEWRRAAASAAQRVPLEVLARRVAAMLNNGPQASWGMQAAAQYPFKERLRLMTQPVLVLRPRDEFWDATARARELLPSARTVDFPNAGPGWYQAAPEALVDATSTFLHG
ncbi:MAG TPA: alpha/beta fold hydrolase [Steroidobacteraceae bacterium]